MSTYQARQRLIQYLLIFFIIALALSGLTAIPLAWEINILNILAGPGSGIGDAIPALDKWIGFVHEGLTSSYGSYPFLAYGTDWLAFAHVVIAIAFVGVLREPVRNIWVVNFGLIACALIIPWALIFGSLRGIPFFWILVDLLFGIFGFIPLWLARREILRLESPQV